MSTQFAAVATRPGRGSLGAIWIAQALLALTLSVMGAVKIMIPPPDLSLSLHQSAVPGPESSIALAVAIDPLDVDTLYVGTLWDGIFKTTDGGTSWINAGLSHTSVFSLVIDPTNPATLYAGGNGVFKSVDSARSWTSIDSGLTELQLYGLADPRSHGFRHALRGHQLRQRLQEHGFRSDLERHRLRPARRLHLQPGDRSCKPCHALRRHLSRGFQDDQWRRALDRRQYGAQYRAHRIQHPLAGD